MLLPNRHGSVDSYRYGFQGQEKDDEIKGEGNSINYKYRMHDPRVGRFFAVDPLSDKFAWNSPYTFSENQVLLYVEFEGLQTGPTMRPGYRSRPVFRNNTNKQLYRLNQARQQADFKRTTAMRFREQFQVLESESVQNIQQFINKYKLNPSDPSNSVGSPPPIADLLEQTIDLAKKLREITKTEDFQFTNFEDNLSIKINDVQVMPTVEKNSGFHYKLYLLEQSYNAELSNAYNEYYKKFDENGFSKNGSNEIYNPELFEFNFKLKNGPSPFELISIIVEEAQGKGQIDIIDEKIIYEPTINTNN